MLSKITKHIVDNLDNIYTKDPNIIYQNSIPTFAEICTRRYRYSFEKNIKKKHRFKYFFIKILLLKEKKTYLNPKHIKTLFTVLSLLKNSKKGLFFNRMTHLDSLFEFHYSGKYDVVASDFDLIAKKYYLLIKFIAKFNKVKNIQPIILCNTLNDKALDLLLLFKPANSITIRYVDMLDNFDKKLFESVIAKALSKKINIESYSKKDAAKYKLKYVPNQVSKKHLLEFIKENNIKDDNYKAVFLGAVSANRLKLLFDIALKLQRFNVHCLYIIKADSSLDKATCIKQIVKYNELLKEQCFVYLNEFLNYKEYLKLSLDAKIFIDFCRKYPDEGYSYRVAESIILNKILITDRDLLDERFYNTENIKDFNFNNLNCKNMAYANSEELNID